MAIGLLGSVLAGAGGGLSAGAGSAIVNIALISYSAANTFINSYYFGYGMILGERDMYQNDWPKIQDRIEKGETFLTILEEKMREKTAAIMALAGDIQVTVDTNYTSVMLQRLLEKPGEAFSAILKMLGLSGDEGATKEAEFIEAETTKVFEEKFKKGKAVGKGSATFIPPIISKEPFTGKLKKGKSSIAAKIKVPEFAIKLYHQTLLDMQTKIKALFNAKKMQKINPSLFNKNKPLLAKMKKWTMQIEQLQATLKTMETSYPGIK